MNNNSKVLALKYRPQTFDDLIGQEVVAETITNSIKADKIPNAYLFTGIRGIGKTSCNRGPKRDQRRATRPLARFRAAQK